MALDPIHAASVGSSTPRPGAEGDQEVPDGSVHGYFCASSQCGSGTHSSGFASTPQCWGERWHGSCSGGCQTSMTLVISVEGEDLAVGMLL